MQTSRQMKALLSAPHTHTIRFSRPHALPHSQRSAQTPSCRHSHTAGNTPPRTRTRAQIGSARPCVCRRSLAVTGHVTSPAEVGGRLKCAKRRSLACRSAASVSGFVGPAACAGRRRRGGRSGARGGRDRISAPPPVLCGRLHRAAHARGRVPRQPAQIPCVSARQGRPGAHSSGLTGASTPPSACPHARRAACLRKRARRRGAGRAAGQDMACCGSCRSAHWRQRRRISPGAGGGRARAPELQRGGQARRRAGGGSARGAGPAGVGV